MLAGVRLLLTAAAAVLAVLGLSAGPASAHAVMTSSTPGEGERLPTAPEAVTFSFNEEIEVGLGGVSVLDRDGERVDSGTTDQPAPNRASAQIEGDLEDGTYLASYRVVSADGHVISDAIVFAVGDDLDEASVADVGDQADTVSEAVGLIGRALLYGGTLLAIGLAFFARVLHDGASDARRFVPVVRIAVVVAALGALGKVASLAADATGRDVGVVTESGVLSEVLRQGGVGWWLVGLLLGLALVHVGVGLRGRTAAQSLVFYGGLIAAGSFALTGHATDADPRVAIGVADAVHVAVASIWFGGVTGLVLLLRWRSGNTNAAIDTAGVVIRFSNVAAVAIVVLWVTGLIQAWWTVGDLDGLGGTDYGRVLLVKLGLVAVTLGVAAWNRWRLVPELLDAEDMVESRSEEGETAAPVRWHRLSRTAGVEAVVIALAVLATAVLVDTPPARTADAAAQPFSETLPVGEDLQVNLGVIPGTVGENEFHVVYLDDAGMATDRPEALTVELSLPDLDVGPIEEDGNLVGDGHFIVSTDSMAVAGTWHVDLTVRTDGFDQYETSFQVPIGG